MINTPNLQEYQTTALLLLDSGLHVRYANPAAENMLRISRSGLDGVPLQALIQDPSPLIQTINRACTYRASFMEYEMELTTTQGTALLLTATVTPLESGDLLLECQQTDQQARINRLEQMRLQQQANRELLRNLAHEIRNPLGGIRGAAQLLEAELDNPEIQEYTRVITEETDRLTALMDRLLTPNQLPRIAPVNIHDILERVRSLILAEYPDTLLIRRDYDISLPEIQGDADKLIQAVLNITRNAAQAMEGQGRITYRTRIARQVTLGKRRHRLAIVLEIQDNGPGIPADLLTRIFYPLISGRNGGSGLGLTIAQTFIHQHEGAIECRSRPGETIFTLVLPLLDTPPSMAGTDVA